MRAVPTTPVACATPVHRSKASLAKLCIVMGGSREARAGQKRNQKVTCVTFVISPFPPVTCEGTWRVPDHEDELKSQP